MESGAGWSRMGSLFVAALVGGGAAVAIGAAIDSGDGGTTTVFNPVASAADSSGPIQADSDDSLTVQEIYQHAGPGVLQVTSTSVDSSDPFFGPQARVSLGSGFVIDKDGYIVTNYHVIESARQIEVNFSGDDRVQATIVGVDPSTDLALLKISAQARALTPLPLGDSDAVRVGDAVVAIGNPFGLERTVTAGIVSALQREITAPNGYTIDKVIQTDAGINQGNSGGPLLNARGEVIGVNSQIEPGNTGTGNPGIGFAVPSATLREVVSQIREGGKVEHAYLGVFTQPIDEVIPGSPADEAGIRDGDRQVIFGGQSYVLGGDIVTAADGEQVASADDLRRLIAEKDPGDAMTLDIRRGESKRTVSVTLGRRPIAPSG
jgi:putative serine protease PepD